MLCQHSFASLDWGLCALHAASRPEALSMGGWVPRSLHHLECARHVCNGPSHASLQTVFSLRKLHKDLDVERVDKHFHNSPLVGWPFHKQMLRQHAQVDTLEDQHTHMHTRLEHMHKGKTQAEFVCSFSALFGICQLWSQADNHYRSNQIACCLKCLENKLA